MKCSEENYIMALKKGKEEALEFIMDKYMNIVNGTVYKVLLRIEKDGLIEECINDVFLSVWNNRKNFSGDSTDFKKWIYKIAKYKAIDYYRKEMKNKEVSSEEIDAGSSNSSEDEFFKVESSKEIINLLDSLEEIDKKIFTMKFLLGIKSEQISETLGITTNVINTRVCRCRKKLNKNNANYKMEGI